MSDNIQGTISKIEFKVKNGKLKSKKVKLKKDVMDKLVSPEIRELVKGADNVLKSERKEINKKNRKEAHNPVTDAKVKLSKEIAQDLGHKIS